MTSLTPTGAPVWAGSAARAENIIRQRAEWNISDWRKNHIAMHTGYGEPTSFVRDLDRTEVCQMCGECNPFTGTCPDSVVEVFGGGQDRDEASR